MSYISQLDVTPQVEAQFELKGFIRCNGALKVEHLKLGHEHFIGLPKYYSGVVCLITNQTSVVKQRDAAAQ